jgi:hypothetical protein
VSSAFPKGSYVLRGVNSEVVERVRSMFTGRSRPTWITLESLSYTAIGSMVSKTLHRPNEDCIPLTHIIYKASCGNAFSARNVLTTLQRQHHVCRVLFPSEPCYLCCRSRLNSTENIITGSAYDVGQGVYCSDNCPASTLSLQKKVLAVVRRYPTQPT